jgi:hypothetical protein
MQTHAQTRLEVGIDLVLSLLVNVGAQLLVYKSLATAGRSFMFAALVLGCAVPRRYTTRRLFNAWLTNGTPQTRQQSWLEVGTDTVIGLGVAVVLQWMIYGSAATWAKAGGLTVVLYAMTLGRRYMLRRLFETRSARQSMPTRYNRRVSSPLEPMPCTARADLSPAPQARE